MINEFEIEKTGIYYQVQEKNNETFHNFKLKKTTEAILSIDGKNKVLFGMPRIVYRTRNKTYGNQIYFQFWIQEKGQDYNASSEWSNFEIYFTEEEGLRFLETTLKFIKKLRGLE